MSKILEINATTGEEIVRDLTKDEQADLDKAVAKQVDLTNQEVAKATAKAAIADRLGLTADELALLLA
jgi:hydroxymethylpyrimidine pyrophosphatase-like HAD family hydrolase